MEGQSRRIFVRVSDAEYDGARDLAASMDLTVSALIRLLLQLLASSIRNVESTDAFVVLDTRAASHLAREMRRWGYHYNQSVHALNSIAYYLRLGEADATDALEALETVRERVHELDGGVRALRKEMHAVTGRVIVER